MKKMILLGMLIAASFSQVSMATGLVADVKVEDLQLLSAQRDAARKLLQKLLAFSQKTTENEDCFDVFKKIKLYHPLNVKPARAVDKNFDFLTEQIDSLD